MIKQRIGVVTFKQKESKCLSDLPWFYSSSASSAAPFSASPSFLRLFAPFSFCWILYVSLNQLKRGRNYSLMKCMTEGRLTKWQTGIIGFPKLLWNLFWGLLGSNTIFEAKFFEKISLTSYFQRNRPARFGEFWTSIAARLPLLKQMINVLNIIDLLSKLGI